MGSTAPCTVHDFIAFTQENEEFKLPFH